LLQALAAQVQVTHGRLDVAVSQQTLQRHQVSACLQHVRGIAVPQRMHRGGFGQSRHDQRLSQSTLQGSPMQGFALTVGEQIVSRSVRPPVGTQFLQQASGQRHTAILVALAAAHPEQAACAVEVGDTHTQDLAQPQATTIGQTQHEPLARLAHGGQQAADFLGTEDDGQFLRLAGEGKVRHELATPQDVGIEEAQGTGGLVEGTPGDLLVDEMQLEGSQLVGTGLIRGAAGEAHQAKHAGKVGFEGAWGVVAASEFIEKALTQRGHAVILRPIFRVRIDEEGEIG